MKLSTRARYALRMMVEIASRSEAESRVSLNQIAKNTRLSRRYLEQLAIGLKNASLIVGATGKGGGYSLARPPEEIQVKEIIEAAIGPINIVECVGRPELCIQVDGCACRPVYEEINRKITDILKGFSLADLSTKGHSAAADRF